MRAAISRIWPEVSCLSISRRSLIGTGFRTEKNHLATGAAQRTQGFVGIAQQRVDAAFAPPFQLERSNARGQLCGIGLTQKEIIVVKLHRIDRIFALQMRKHSGGAFGRFRFLAPVGDFGYAAKLASIRAAVAGVVHRGARSQERPRDVLRGLAQSMVRHPGKIAGRANRPVLRVDTQAEWVFIGNAGDVRKSRPCRIAPSSSGSVSSPWPRTSMST